MSLIWERCFCREGDVVCFCMFYFRIELRSGSCACVMYYPFDLI